MALVASSNLPAQVRPQPSAGDPRIQSIEYRAEQVVLIEAAPGYQVTVQLAPDEIVESAAVGDSGAWQVAANRAGNSLFVKPLQADADTNLTVITNVRTYAFELRSAANLASAPYIMTFRFAMPAEAGVLPTETAQPEEGAYRLGGARALRPTRIHDDGTHTFIEWASDALLPATYMVEDGGREVLANGAMRNGIYVIDGVAQRLRFRLDDRSARADRFAPGARRR